MEYDFSLWTALLLAALGLLAGFINTIAGGGSMLTLPGLLLLGMPADIANGTNRVGILMQSAAGARAFDAVGGLDRSAILPMLAPTLAGALAGSLLASYLPVALLKPILLGCMMGLALAMALRPALVFPAEGEAPLSLQQRPGAAFGLFLAGVYGGFVQAGVGFMLLAAFAGALRYDLVRSNALKTVCTGVFSAVALAVFALRGQVWWLPGLALGLGSVLGAGLAVNFAVRVRQKTLQWALFAMVTATCLGALLS